MVEIAAFTAACDGLFTTTACDAVADMRRTAESVRNLRKIIGFS